MELIRKIIFYIFVAAYLVVCPLIILYSFGYIVNPLKEHLVYTGIIYLSTTPSGAQVFLEKSQYKNKTPATIHDLLPGKYTVRVLLHGYRPWKHGVTVEKGKAAAFEKILLIPDRWIPRQLSAEAYADLTPMPGNDYFLLSKDGKLKDFFVYDWKRGRVRPLLSAQAELKDLRVSELFSREDSQVLVVSGGAVWDQKYYYLKLTPEATEVQDISGFISDKPLQIFWDPSGHDSIFTLHRGYIDRIDIAASVLYPKCADDVRGWGI
ncbi:MAG: PEGA domain-containing protein, partial [Candidatus Omnitrophica bacterium]|nr:PEGA domain-containing protein [Candidatus Omnitrophota bacterium]